MLLLLLAAAPLGPSAPKPLAPLGSLVAATDYPAAAKRRGVTGHVRFRLRVDATGRPDGCVVSQTSGSPELDNATCDVMLARARFVPALGSDGKPVRGDYTAEMTWVLDEAAEPVTSEVIRVRSELDGTGKVASCTAAPADEAAQFGGCTAFSDARLLGHLIGGRPLTGFAWIEMRMIKQASTDKPVADPIPTGAEKMFLLERPSPSHRRAPLAAAPMTWSRRSTDALSTCALSARRTRTPSSLQPLRHSLGSLRL